MEVKFQNAKYDYIEFYKIYFWDRLKSKMFIIALLLTVIGFFSSGSPFQLNKFIAGIIIAAALLLLVSYVIPLVVSIIRLNKTLAKEDAAFDEKSLIMTDAGIEVKSVNKNTFWNWESIVSVNTNEKFIYILLADKRIFLLLKESFSSESEIMNFIGFIQTKILRTRGYPVAALDNRNTPPYLIGLLGFIPLIGAFVGFALILYGIFKYKDKWLVTIGFGGIAFTIFVYSFMFYNVQFGAETRKGFAQISKSEVTSLIGNIEFYKLKHGAYPDSLEQIEAENQMAWINDPLQVTGDNDKKSTKFNYQKVGDHYYLFSSGIDRIPNTKDDIYPEIAPSDSVKFGWIKNK